jgi:glucose-1-phosphate adenylyltransferase
MKRVTAFILAGGEGRRMASLTDHEAKPAVPFGGGFKLIDFTLLNCARSNVHRAVAIVQHQPETLTSHLRNPPREIIGAVNLRTAQPAVDEHYTGTADAVRMNLRFIDWTVDHVLIAPADLVYRMDYSRMLEAHVAHDADVTLATLDLPREDTSRYGVLAADEDGRVLEYAFRPSEPRPLPGAGDRSRVAMGVYLFKRDVLSHLIDPLSGPAPAQLAEDVIPLALAEHRVFAFQPAVHDPEFSGYWRDINTLHDFWQANMEFLHEWRNLLKEEAGALLPRGLMYVENGFEGRVINSFVPSGLELFDGEIRDSVISPSVQLKGRVPISESIVQAGVVIEDGCEVRKAILDREARLTGEARVAPRRMRPGSQIKTISGLTVVPRGVLVRGPAKIPRPTASMPREERRAGVPG